MEKILFFDTGKVFDKPTLQYSASSDNEVLTLVGTDAIRVYKEIRRKELILLYGSYDKAPDFIKTNLAKL